MADSLAQLEQRFFHLIAARDGVASGLAELAASDPGAAPIDRWLEGKAEERMEVYANAYLVRLFEVLADDFSRVAATIGELPFHNLVTLYLDQHRSTKPSLRHLGQHLPSYLIGHPLTERWPQLPDLAALEWCRLSVFDVLDQPLLEARHLEALAPEAWAALPLRSIEAVRLLQVAHPVHWLWSEDPAQQARAAEALPVTLLIWRREHRVWHRPLAEAEHAALAQVLRGTSFGELCAQLPGEDLQATAATAVTFLRRWLEEGLLLKNP